tara:strand:- start:65 stop:1600 length:1536 start_codon:yes stop_codon:yes gene_type:complete
MAEIYVPGGFDFMAAGNALSQMQTAQQARQSNALQMQYDAEDRARAAQERSAAAGNARAELVRKQQFMDTIKGGYMPAKTAVMGPGTVQGNTPASFDPEKVKNELFRLGDLSGLVTFSNAQEQFAKQTEQEAKAAGQSLINEETQQKTKFATAQTDKEQAETLSKYITLHKEQLNSARNYDEAIALTIATYTPGHPMAAWLAKNGVSQEQAVAELTRRRDEGIPFEETRALMARGATNAAQDAATLTQSQAAARSSDAAATSSLATAAKTKYEMDNPGVTIEDVVLPSGETIKVTVNSKTGKVERLMLGDETLAPKAVPLSESQVKQEALLKGKKDVDLILGMLLNDYDELDKMQAIPNDERPVAENLPNYLAGTALGQEAGKAQATKAQTLRNNVQSNARFLLTAIKNATGMSAQEMNSIPELKALQEAATNPTQSIQSIRRIISNASLIYGEGKLNVKDTPKTEAAPKTDDKPKIAKLSDIEHTAKLKNLSIEEVKKRVRALGMTIEGE